METVTLQEALRRIDKIDEGAISDNELRRGLDSFRLDPPHMQESNPFSPAYRHEILHIYEQLFGQPFNVTNEGLDINADHELAWGFPYGTKNSTTIGSFLIAFGYLIKTMNLMQGARVLEVGCGTGALTRHLAKSGFRVTSLEVNSSNVELVNRMTARYPVRPQVILGDATAFEPSEQYDAIIFFESLHHFIEHEKFLKCCVSWLAEDGMIAFCAEPIYSKGHPSLAYPWGLRLDGQSLRGMYRFGWIELGFRQSYFDQLMQRVGLMYSRHLCVDSHWSEMFIATPIHNAAPGDQPRPKLAERIGLNLHRLTGRLRR